LAIDTLVLQGQVEDELQAVENRCPVAAVALADAATDLGDDLAVCRDQAILRDQLPQAVVESREAFFFEILQKFFYLESEFLNDALVLFVPWIKGG